LTRRHAYPLAPLEEILDSVFRNLVFTGNHDYWNLWLEALYFGGNLMPIHLGHVVVNDHCGKSAHGCNL